MVNGFILVVGVILVTTGAAVTRFPQTVNNIGARRRYENSTLSDYGLKAKRISGILFLLTGLFAVVLALS